MTFPHLAANELPKMQDIPVVTREKKRELHLRWLLHLVSDTYCTFLGLDPVHFIYANAAHCVLCKELV